jgi:hypothetical protein
MHLFPRVHDKAYFHIYIIEFSILCLPTFSIWHLGQ